MIQINLLPGARKKSKSRSGSSAMASLSAVFAQVKDPFLLAAVASVAVAAGAVGALYLAQTRQAGQLADRERAAVQDSTRYAAVLAERVKAQAQVDSVTRQLAVIREIDNNRYVWPHVMDEVSRALPPYTWLTSLQQTSAPALPAQTLPKAEAPKKPKPGAGKGKEAPARDTVARPALKFRIVGNTVDIQALTRFMKDLEASPFVQGVTLNKTTLIPADGKEVTQFELDCEYQTPAPAAIQTVAVSSEVR